MACDVARSSDDAESRKIAENWKYISKELKTRVRDKQSIRHLQDVVSKVQTENTVLKGQLEEERLKTEFMKKQYTEQAENLKLLSSREQALSEKLVSCRIEMGKLLKEAEKLKRQLQESEGRPLSKVKSSGHHDELETCLAEAKQEAGPGIINPHKITDRQNLRNGRFGHAFRALYEHKPVVVDQIVVPAGLNVHRVQEKRLLQRWNTSQGLTSNFIMEVFGFCLDSERGIYWLIMEFMARGCLSGLLEEKTFESDLDRENSMALNVGRGIDFLHNHEDPMLLRNICCANILVSEDLRDKICDVGDIELEDRADSKTKKFSRTVPITRTLD